MVVCVTKSQNRNCDIPQFEFGLILQFGLGERSMCIEQTRLSSLFFMSFLYFVLVVSVMVTVSFRLLG